MYRLLKTRTINRLECEVGEHLIAGNVKIGKTRPRSCQQEP